MSMKKHHRRFSLFSLAITLLVMIGIQLFLVVKAEDHLLSRKQDETISKLKQEFKSSKSSLDVQSVEIGKPLAILDIPTINLSVPVYYGTTDDVLNEGIGLLEGTSDLEGGNGKHSVLTGHNGLSENRLFTQLDEMKKKDVFSITTQSGTRAYVVEDIKVIPAEKLHENTNDYIKVDEKKELVTLVTCTPRNVNSHRLLVRAHFTTEKPKAILTSSERLTRHVEKRPIQTTLMCLGIVLVVSILTVILYEKRRRD